MLKAMILGAEINVKAISVRWYDSNGNSYTPDSEYPVSKTGLHEAKQAAQKAGRQWARLMIWATAAVEMPSLDHLAHKQSPIAQAAIVSHFQEVNVWAMVNTPVSQLGYHTFFASRYGHRMLLGHGPKEWGPKLWKLQNIGAIPGLYVPDYALEVVAGYLTCDGFCPMHSPEVTFSDS